MDPNSTPWSQVETASRSPYAEHRAQSVFSNKLHSFRAVHSNLYPLFSQILTVLNVPKKYPLAIHYP